MRRFMYMFIVLFTLSSIASAGNTPEGQDVPGKHKTTFTWINGDPDPTRQLQRVLWTQRCELRADKHQSGFFFDAKVNDDGTLGEINVRIMSLFGISDDPEVKSCLKGEISKFKFDVSEGFVPGHEGAGKLKYSYLLP